MLVFVYSLDETSMLMDVCSKSLTVAVTPWLNFAAKTVPGSYTYSHASFGLCRHAPKMSPIGQM